MIAERDEVSMHKLTTSTSRVRLGNLARRFVALATFAAAGMPWPGTRALAQATTPPGGGGGGGGSTIIVSGRSIYFEVGLVVLLFGAVLYAVCRSSRRN